MGWHPAVEPAAGHDNNRTRAATMRNSIRCQSISIYSVSRYHRQFYVVPSGGFLSRQAAAKEIESAIFLWIRSFLKSSVKVSPDNDAKAARASCSKHHPNNCDLTSSSTTNTQRPLSDTRRPTPRHPRQRRDS
jgi:hypothetical protein